MHPHLKNPPKNPRIVAWEITRRCNLRCIHCRADACEAQYENEFSTEECFRTIDTLAAFSKPMIIMTGGEPMMRPDIYEITRYATDKGLRVVMAPCGHLLTAETSQKLKDAGVMAISISLDAATAEKHNAFRGIPEAYEKTLAGLETAKAVGIPFQINTTVSKNNIDELPEILARSIELGASAQDFFFLVPTGRGKGIADLALEPDQRDAALKWIAEQSITAPLNIRTTCAPQYKAIWETIAAEYKPDAAPRISGCMGGRGFVFLSHTGDLQPCGFLELDCGNLRNADFDFEKVYKTEPGFSAMRKTHPFGECPARCFAHTGSIDNQHTL